jgi:hypothetical protein
MVIATRLRRLLEAPRLPLGLAVIAVLLCAPSLRIGLQADDYYLNLALTDPPVVAEWVRTPASLFSFFDREAAVRQALEKGVVPWWTNPGLRLAFFRPLAGVTHWLDFRLWPGHPWLMHLQSLLWFGATIAVAALLYRRLMGPGWVAGLAALAFALDDAHASPAAWLANRNAVLGTLFGLVTLALHDRWRREGWRPGRFLAPASLLLALLGGEIALATGGYLLAYALFLDRGAWRDRLLSLLPCGTAGVVWALAYRSLGYGARGSAVYIDPAADPALFARAAFERGPLLLMGQWSLPSHWHGALSETAGHGLWLFACALAGLLAIVLAPLIRREPLARFFALGMVLSLVPSCATFPHDRLLFLAGFGGFGLLAIFLAGLWQGAAWLPVARLWRAPARALGGLLVAFHLVFAPLGLLHAPAELEAFGDLIGSTAASLPSDPALPTQQVLIVHTPSAFVSIYGLPLRWRAGLPVPARLFVLGSSVHAVTIERPARDALLIRPEGGFLNPHGRALPGREQPAIDFRYVLALLDGLYRESPAMRLGERIELPGLTVEITALTADARPAEVRFSFARALEDPALVWLRWEAGVYVPFTLPAVGESVSLPAPVVPFG